MRLFHTHVTTGLGLGLGLGLVQLYCYSGCGGGTKQRAAVSLQHSWKPRRPLQDKSGVMGLGVTQRGGGAGITCCKWLKCRAPHSGGSTRRHTRRRGCGRGETREQLKKSAGDYMRVTCALSPEQCFGHKRPRAEAGACSSAVNDRRVGTGRRAHLEAQSRGCRARRRRRRRWGGGDCACSG